MSNIIYLKMYGEQQGDISAGCGTKDSVGNRFQLGHESEIFVFALFNSMTGTGKGINLQGLSFIKLIDKSSPLLSTAISNNEKFFLEFSFYRTNQYGKWEKYYYIELRGATLAGVTMHFSDNNLDTEVIEVCYEYILCKHLTANTEFSHLAFPADYNALFSQHNPIVAAQQAEKQLKTLNSKGVGRLLAAGGIYNGNPEGFRKAAEQLGGEAPEGYDQVLNEKTKGVAIAAASVAAALGIGRVGVEKKLSAISGVAKAPVVTAELEVNGRKFIDTNQTARPPELADANNPTLISARIEAKNKKAVDKAIAKGNPEPPSLPNGNMRDAHAEIGAIQQAHEAGIAKGADLNMTVKGLDVCDYCKGDIPAAAQAAGAKSIKIDAVDSFGDPIQYYWEQGMKKMKVIK